MEKQIIITVGREYGSGGHVIANMLAERFHIPYYNRNLIEEVAKQHDFDTENIKDYDETPRKYLFSRSVHGYSNSPEEIFAGLQFDYIRSMATEGKSFVIVGRCADFILQELDCVTSFFIVANEDAKLKRTMKCSDLTERDAEAAIKRHDRNRKTYYKDHTNAEWGNSKNYDLTINSSILGFQRTADILEQFVKAKYNL